GSVLVGLVSVGWAAYARVVRGMVLELRERDFVAAARALGASDQYIVTRHIIPNVLPAIAVLATVEMGELILALAGFGFLGVGIQPPTPEWGAMINDARPFVLDAPARTRWLPSTTASSPSSRLKVLPTKPKFLLRPSRSRTTRLFRGRLPAAKLTPEGQW
ncbi:MAG: ABC transporter permease subunit, partial [Gemmatimonadaceae bacterium]|nr:ABC transporter permease subunit [Gemmatimonadaceae bacterium]